MPSKWAQAELESNSLHWHSLEDVTKSCLWRHQPVLVVHVGSPGSDVNLHHCLPSSLLFSGIGVLVPPETELSRRRGGCPSALLLAYVHGEVDCHGSGCGLLVLPWPVVMAFGRHCATTWRAPGKDSATRVRTSLNLIMMRR